MTATTRAMTTDEPNHSHPGEVQRIVHRGSPAVMSRHVLLRVPHAHNDEDRDNKITAALEALRQYVRGDGGSRAWPGDGEAPRDVAAPEVAIGITVQGLRALGLVEREIETFPLDFRQGPAARSAFLGDVDRNKPDEWADPFAPSDDPRAEIHLVVSGWSDTDDMTHWLPAALIDGTEPAPFEVVEEGSQRLVGNREHDELRHPSRKREGDRDLYSLEWFGFQDGDSQPKIGWPDAPLERHEVPLGEFVVGNPTELGDVSLRWRVPGTESEPSERVGWSGSFAALRVMKQDVDQFNAWLETEAASQSVGEEDLDREELASWLCGRWRPSAGARTSGALLPQDGSKRPETDFRDDYDGRACPIGSHIRRANPRNGWTVSRGAHRRRIIRRGIPYGWRDGDGEWVERGLIGYFICADLSAQYEAVLTDWIHGGVHDPWISGTNDPLIGVQPESRGLFRHDTGHEVYEMRVPQFVFTKGVLYLFLPSKPGILRLIEKCDGARRAREQRRGR